MGGAEDLDEFGDTVADLCSGNGAQEGTVDYGRDGLVVATDAIFEAVEIDGDAIGDRGVDEADESGGNSDIASCAAVDEA